MRILQEKTSRANLKYHHPAELVARWPTLPFHLQMGNIGSEISRSLRWYGRDVRRFQGAFERALELFDLSIATLL